MISTFKGEYIDFLKKYDLLEELFAHLAELASYQSVNKGETLASSTNLELRLNMMLSNHYQ